MTCMFSTGLIFKSFWWLQEPSYRTIYVSKCQDPSQPGQKGPKCPQNCLFYLPIMIFRLDALNLPQCTGLAWGELQSCNCKLRGGGKVSPSLDTIVCPGADTLGWPLIGQPPATLPSDWLTLGASGLAWPGSMTPRQRWGWSWWHLRTPSSWFLKIMGYNWGNTGYLHL